MCRAGLIHPLPTAPLAFEACGPVDKAWISPADTMEVTYTKTVRPCPLDFGAKTYPLMKEDWYGCAPC